MHLPSPLPHEPPAAEAVERDRLAAIVRSPPRIGLRSTDCPRSVAAATAAA